MLDEIEAQGRGGDLRAVAEAAVLPLAELLRSDEGAVNYARFLTEIFVTPSVSISEFVDGRLDHGLRRAHRMIQLDTAKKNGASPREADSGSKTTWGSNESP